MLEHSPQIGTDDQATQAGSSRAVVQQAVDYTRATLFWLEEMLMAKGTEGTPALLVDDRVRPLPDTDMALPANRYTTPAKKIVDLRPHPEVTKVGLQWNQPEPTRSQIVEPTNVAEEFESLFDRPGYPKLTIDSMRHRPRSRRNALSRSGFRKR